MAAPSNLRSPLGIARGLGSAKEGLHHWWGQRVTAIALIPLTLWFVVSLIHLASFPYGSDTAQYDAFMSWISNPCNATLMILFLGTGFHHGQLGLQVVLEDYVAGHGRRLASIIAVKLVCYGLATLGIVSTLIVCFGG